MSETAAAARVRRSVVVDAARERAFDCFVNEMDRWWNPDHHVLPGSIVEMVVEPWLGAAIYDLPSTVWPEPPGTRAPPNPQASRYPQVGGIKRTVVLVQRVLSFVRNGSARRDSVPFRPNSCPNASMLHIYECGELHEERCETSDKEARRTGDGKPGCDLDGDLNNSSDEQDQRP